MADSPVEVQIKALHELIASPERRAEFLRDPSAYATKNKVSFDPVVEEMTHFALSQYERELARLGAGNPYLPTDSPLLTPSGGPPVQLGRVTTAAATLVVSAVAAVVSAAASVTSATSAAKTK